MTKAAAILESVLTKDILRAVGSLPDVRAWRNNTGRLRDKNGRLVSYGLCIGSADIIGLVLPFGRFMAIEVKTDQGKLTPEQEQWLAIVRRFGGVSGVARCVDDALALVEEARKTP